MSFLNTAKKNVTYEREAKGYMEMKMKMKKKKSPENMGKFIVVGWEKSKQNRFQKEVKRLKDTHPS